MKGSHNMQIKTQQDAVIAIKSHGIKGFSISSSFTEPLVCNIIFYNVHWYSFSKRTKIERVKIFLQKHGPVNVLWDFKTTKNKIGGYHA